MTRMGKLSTLAMGLTTGYEDDYKGLVPENDLNELSMKKSWADEEDEETPVVRKSKVKHKPAKPHLLDHSDTEAVFRGGWLRHKFYKSHGRKTPLTISNTQTEGTCCRACQEKVADKLDMSNLSGSVHFEQLYLKTLDAHNRELPETALALLMLFDWVGICPSCSEMNYGYFKVEEAPVTDVMGTIETQTKRILATADGVVEDIKTRIDAPNARPRSRPAQLSIFDFDDTGSLVVS